MKPQALPPPGAPATPGPSAPEQDYEAILLALVQAVLAALEPPHTASTLFIGQLLLALRTHLLARYGAAGPAPGGLAQQPAWRAKDYLAGQPLQQLSIGKLATLCGLSRSHFSKAFKRSTGQSPYQWAMRHRLQQVAEQLIGDQPMGEIAAACGFAHPRHMARAFRREMGISPSAWRRQYRSSAAG